MAIVEINKENAAHFLRAQIYLTQFTSDDPNLQIINQAIEYILNDNKNLSSEIDRLKKEIQELKSNDKKDQTINQIL